MKKHSMLPAWSLLALALGVCSFASSAEAQTDPYICLDNSPNGGSIPNTSTSNVVTVSVKFCGQATFTPIDSRVLNTVSGCHQFMWDDDNTPGRQWVNVDEIRVSINGQDMYWLDQIELFDPFGVRKWVSGADNLDGRCFSTNASDSEGNNSICDPDTIQATHPPYNVPSLNCG